MGTIVRGVTFIVILLLAGCASGAPNMPLLQGAPPEPSIEACRDCNVILISMDTLRADHLGAYGYTQNTSPFTDTFAKQSILFQDAQSQAPYTLPSHMSILTSLYPHFHKIVLSEGKTVLDSEIKTLTELLKTEGYTTAWFGPLDGPALNLERGFERGFDEFHECGFNGCLDKGSDCWEPVRGWLDTLDTNKRFFLSIQTYKVHFPYVPSELALSRFTTAPHGRIITSLEELMDASVEKVLSHPEIMFTDEALRRNRSFFDNASVLRSVLLDETMPPVFGSAMHRDFCGIVEQTFWETVNKTDDRDMRFVKSLYDAEIFEFDQQFEELVATLEERDILNRTIIILTSSHGEEFMEHGEVSHTDSLYNELIHVPLIIKTPAVESAGIVFTYPVELIDIMPTTLTLLGLELPGYVQGVDLVPLLGRDRDTLAERARISEFEYLLKSIQVREWKLIVRIEQGGSDCFIVEGRSELYNLQEDPLEEHNVRDSHPEIAERLETTLVESLARREDDLPGHSPLCYLRQ